MRTEDLARIVREHGPRVYASPALCRAFLADLMPGAVRERNVLLTALEQGVVDELRQPQDAALLTARIGRLAQRLADEQALDPNAARWAVEAWAGVFTADTPNFDAPLPPPDPARADSTGFGEDVAEAPLRDDPHAPDRDLILRDASGPVTAVAIARRGAQVVAGSVDGVWLWTTRNGEPLALLDGVGLPVRAVAVSESAGLVAGLAGGRVHLWDDLGEPLGAVGGELGETTCLAASADGRWLAVGDAAGCVQVWEADCQELVVVLSAHQGAVTALTFTPSSDRLISAGADRRIRVWPVSGFEAGQAIASPLVAGALAVTPDGTVLAAGGVEGGVRVWSLVDGAAGGDFSSQDGPVAGLVFSAQGELICADAGGLVRWWPTPAGDPSRWRRAAGGPLGGLAVTPAGSCVAVAAGARVELWPWPPRGGGGQR